MSIAIDNALADALRSELQARFGNQFKVNKWKSRKFSFYTGNEHFPKMDVLTATLNVARSLALVIPEPIQKNLQLQVTLESAPNDVFPHMSAALDAGTPED